MRIEYLGYGLAIGAFVGVLPLVGLAVLAVGWRAADWVSGE